MCAAFTLIAALIFVYETRPTDAGSAGRVVVVGDSISTLCCAPSEDQWPVVLARRLGAEPSVVAVGGATSESLINQLRTWPSGREQTQLNEALALLEELPDVRAVTFGIGTNDFLQIVALRDPESGRLCTVALTVACEALRREALASFEDNVHTALKDLSMALGPDTALLVMTVYVGGGDQRLNPIIKAEAAEHGALVADVAAYFDELDAADVLAADGIHKAVGGHHLIANVFSNLIPPDTDGDGLSGLMEWVLGSDARVQDSDGDGCTDGAEFGPRAADGGQRDPTSYWDFYDVWTRSAGGEGWERNKVVDIVDIVGVAQRFGPGTPPSGHSALAAALMPPVDAESYHAAFDRGPDLSPADGLISLPDDILAAVAQFGHSCALAPQSSP